MLHVRLKVLILLTITAYVHEQEHSQKASPLTNIHCTICALIKI